LREVECHVVDLTAESHASSTTVQGSDPVELEHDCGTPANEHVDLSEVKCKEIAPKAETTINAPEEPAVAVTTFENFNERKSCNGVKLEVLRILRREKWEGKLNKALRKALDPNPPHHLSIRAKVPYTSSNQIFIPDMSRSGKQSSDQNSVSHNGRSSANSPASIFWILTTSSSFIMGE
jgi:hypothetical protein